MAVDEADSVAPVASALRSLEARLTRVGRDGARAFLERVASAQAEVARAVGLGDDVRVEDGNLVGEALVVEGRVVHLSALVAAGAAGEASHVERSSVRAGRLARRSRG